MPINTIPNFHEITYFAKKLQAHQPKLQTEEMKQLSYAIMEAYVQLPPLPNSSLQLIHGDPRINNTLFRNGHPFTYIDFDTFMMGSIWVDIGDLLRSVCTNKLQTHAHFSPESVRSIAEGYRSVAFSETNPNIFFEHSLSAMRHISLELAIRFLIDIVEDSYFSWDSTHYACRIDNNLVRAKTQWKIYQDANSTLSTLCESFAKDAVRKLAAST